jgi:hypothetical protein
MRNADALPDIDERVGDSELVRHPHAYHDQREREQTKGPGRRPAPVTSFTENDRHTDHCGAEGRHAEEIKMSGVPVGLPRKHDDDQNQGCSNRDGTEPEGSTVVVELGDQGGDRVPEPGPDRSADREDGHGVGRLLGRELATGDRHGHRQQAQADPLEPPSDHQHGETGRHGREYAPGADDGEGRHNDPALSRPVRQTSHGWRGQCP